MTIPGYLTGAATLRREPVMKQALARLILRAAGWKTHLETELPPKLVLIAAPHTSNWDGFFLVVLAMAMGIKLNWLTKDALFKPPLGAFIRALGGIPVNRGAHHNLVDELAKRFEETDQLILTVPAEGTRGRADYWKSGFFHIAEQARVPIGLGFLDYGKKVGGFGPILAPGGSMQEVMDAIRSFYKDIEPRFPENVGPIRLKAEEPAATSEEPRS